MGKKRVARMGQKRGVDQGLRNRAISRTPRKKLTAGTLHVKATYNNTLLTLSDEKGDSIVASSSGALGFRGAKKGTPYAAAKVGELIGEKATMMGMKEANVIVKGVGAGREAAIRSFSGKGVQLTRIQDETPVPHNGVRPPKARRV